MLRGEMEHALGYPDRALGSYGEGLRATARLTSQLAALHQRRGTLLLHRRDLEACWAETRRAEFDLEVLRGLLRDTVAAALLFAPERLLGPSQVAPLGALPARVGDCVARRKHGQRRQAHVDPAVRLTRTITRWCDRLLSDQADVPVSARCAPHRRAFRDTVGRSVNDRLDQADRGNRDTRIVQHNPLRDAESRRSRLFGRALREALLLVAIPRAAKDVLIGALKIPQRLLQRLRIDLAPPCGCGLLVQPGEVSRKIVVRKRFAGLAVGIARAVQGPIPNVIFSF